MYVCSVNCENDSEIFVRYKGLIAPSLSLVVVVVVKATNMIARVTTELLEWEDIVWRLNGIVKTCFLCVYGNIWLFTVTTIWQGLWWSC